MATLIPSSTPLPDGPRPETAPAPHLPAAGDRATSRTAAGKREPREKVRPRYRADAALDAAERQELGMVAKQAWEACGAKAAHIPADEWRHDQVAIATQGKATRVSDLRRGQFRDVLAHFLTIKGDVARAFRVAERSGQDMADRDLAVHKLREVCEAGGLDYPEYPESICRRQFKIGLDEVETGRIWFLFYTCNTRARRKNEKASEIASEGPTPKTAVVTLENGSDAENPTGGLGENAL